MTELFSTYSDCWKSEFGTRPRGEVTRDEIVAYLDSYNSRIEELSAKWALEGAELDAMIAADEAKRATEREERAARAWEAWTAVDWLSAKLVGDRHP